MCRADTNDSNKTADGADGYTAHPDFPTLSPQVPLTFALTMKACLSQKHTERPSFAQILQLLADLQKEVSKGSYVDSTGRVQARTLPHLRDEKNASFYQKPLALGQTHPLLPCRTSRHTPHDGAMLLCDA